MLGIVLPVTVRPDFGADEQANGSRPLHPSYLVLLYLMLPCSVGHRRVPQSRGESGVSDREAEPPDHTVDIVPSGLESGGRRLHSPSVQVQGALSPGQGAAMLRTDEPASRYCCRSATFPSTLRATRSTIQEPLNPHAARVRLLVALPRARPRHGLHARGCCSSRFWGYRPSFGHPPLNFPVHRLRSKIEQTPEHPPTKFVVRCAASLQRRDLADAMDAQRSCGTQLARTSRCYASLGMAPSAAEMGVAGFPLLPHR